MLKHNIKLFFRNIKRHKSSFFINSIGLVSGLTCVLLIALWVADEINVDRFGKQDDLRFQVMQNTQSEMGIVTSINTPYPLAEALEDEFPEVAHAVSIIPTVFNSSNGTLSVDNFQFKSSAQYVTKDFFEVFPFKILDGDKNNALSAKKGMVITKEIALKFFKTTENVIGKAIQWKVQDIEVQGFVSAVLDTMPKNITESFDVLLSMDLFMDFRPWFNDWDLSAQRTFVFIKEGAAIDQIDAKLKTYLKSKVKDPNKAGTLFIQNYSDNYLHGKYENGEPSGGRIDYIILFSIIALFILIIACVNFMNLSTARASIRMNEVGIKKTMGASRGSLIFQYLIESTLLTFFALAVAILLAFLLLPVFNEVTGKSMVFEMNPDIIWAMFAITFLTAMLAGSYPAIYLSGLKPVSILKGKIVNSLVEIMMRKGLVVFQFAITILLIVAVLVVYQQMNYIQSKDIGYNKNQIVYIRVDKPSEELISQLKEIPGVLHVSGMYNDLPINAEFGTWNDVSWEGMDTENKTSFVPIIAGYDFIKTLEIQLLHGRSFSKDFNSENQVVLNEMAIQEMNIKDPIGKTIKIGKIEQEIIGVVKNFNFESLHENIKPCILQWGPIENMPKFLIKIQAGSEKTTLDKLEKVFLKMSPGTPFDYIFLDQKYEALYHSEQRVATLSKYFASLAIIISCLGLFGLAMFTAERRKKEISVRKILGQTAAQVAIMLSGEFAKLVLVAILVALPIAYLLAGNWLSGFAYHIPLQVWYFVGAGLVALLVAMLTVGSQAVQAANRNPVDGLREE